MIGKFKEFLNEKNFIVATADTAVKYKLSHMPMSGYIVAMAASSKELDKEILLCQNIYVVFLFQNIIII